jgi:hypothetical protein
MVSLLLSSKWALQFLEGCLHWFAAFPTQQRPLHSNTQHAFPIEFQHSRQPCSLILNYVFRAVSKPAATVGLPYMQPVLLGMFPASRL